MESILNAVDTSLARTLELNFSAGRIKKTGKTYTTDSRKLNEDSSLFRAKEHKEYEYNGKKYIRTKYINIFK